MSSDAIRKLIIEDVRCFAGRQEFEIRPLTFLVGENSTGKSTALGCFQILASQFTNTDESALNFNTAPYKMGTFRNIVTRKSPACDQFKLGFELGDKKIREFTVTLAERRQSNELVNKQVEIIFSDGRICFSEQHETMEYRHGNPFQIDTTNTDIAKNSFHILNGLGIIGFPSFFLADYLRVYYPEQDKINQPEGKALARFLEKQDSSRQHNLMVNRPFSFAPVRSRPERTYDPIREFEDPEGSDIPLFLMRVKSSRNDEWKKLQRQLAQFGKSSGLFQSVEVKRHGETMSDPFQIQIKVRGNESNIMDVGYGVSQILPVLARIFISRENRFLLQQPEVHLHPRGQAELTSLFVKTIKQRQHAFIIETHSDYMVDRARIEIRKGNIAPDDVSLVYMEPKGSRVKAHNISFDEQANFINVPASYGDFFLKETDRLLGFEG